MTRRGLSVVALVVGLVGCASRNPLPPSEASPVRPATIFTGPDVQTVLADQPRAFVRMLGAPPAAVWTAVKQVYADYGVPLTVENTPGHQLGNSDFYRTRTFAGSPMAKLVSCGSGITGPNAASYRIYMSLLTTVDGRGKDSTKVSVTFTTSARDMVGGTSADRLPCGSTGELERLFLVRVNTLIAPK